MVRVACVETRDVGLGLRGMVDGEGHLVRGRVRGRGRGRVPHAFLRRVASVLQP